ncbi:MAG TPA: fatty acid desaturase [Planctomycetota bacterium]|nr:fatty acid desaturase [Planctomycetota bacterium]
MTHGHWHEATADLRRELASLDAGRLRDLHRVSTWRHAAVAIRQFLLAGAAGAVIVAFAHRWYVWVPAAAFLGFVIFSFTVLLHEVVHRAVFRRRETTWNRALAWLYALPSGLAPGQFERWHLDHHAELGDEEADPKRAYLSPRRVKRWFKLLYFTPALFPLYFRAAAKAAARYPEELRARLRRERLLVTAAHLVAMAGIGWGFGAPMLLRLYAIPVFLVFPVAFTINRIGQHYDISPEDPAAWGTVIRSNAIWDFLFLWSSYHIEHHYFPRVPFYNLRALHRELKPVFARHPMRIRTYGGLLYDWLIRNKVPHLSWH